LATWAIKTALMLDLSRPEPLIPEGFYRELRLKREPSSNNMVWIGVYGGEQWAAWAAHEPLELANSSEPAGFAATFTAYRALFQVFGHFTRGGFDFTDSRPEAVAIEQIWPIWKLPVVWPATSLAFFDESLVRFAGSMNIRRQSEST
jgi:hypothetical protein